MITTALTTLALAISPSDSTPLTCDGKPAEFHVHRAHAIIDGAHADSRFLDPSPARARERRAWREHKLCLRDPHRRKRIGRYQDRALAEFDAHYESLLDPPGRGWLESTASCESGGDLNAVGAGGLYHGKYQFDYPTWSSVGGSGDPCDASEREQDYRAALLYQRAGSSPWPVCG